MGQIERADALDERTETSIRCIARGMVGQYGYKPSDVADIEQELRLHLLMRREQYDPSRSSWPTFVDRVLRSYTTDMIRKRTSQAMDYKQAIGSIYADDGRLHEHADLPAEPEPLFGVTAVSPSGMDRVDLRIDVWRAISSLRPELQRICLELMHGSLAEAARALGLSRQGIYRVIHEIHEAFVVAGLDDYYVPRLEAAEALV